MNNHLKVLLRATIVVIISFGFFSGCKDWQYDVEKNGIHFKKIHQSKNGNNTGYMRGNHTIQGFPCEKGWIHFDKNWKLLSFQLSNDFMYNNTLLPAHTWLHFPYHKNHTGYVCSFPYNYEVQGYLCGGTGGYKGTHTGFYGSGKLRSFFPPEDVTVNGLLCEASPFASVKLYENGCIKSCKLARDYQIDGKTFKKGEQVEFTGFKETQPIK
jgi:hypothetical protein